MTRRRWVLLVVVVLVAGLLYGWWLLRRGFSARSEPSKLETLVARTARSLATPADAAALENPQPRTPENLRDGMLHFADHCAICHGNDGRGNTDFGQNMYPRAPDMRLTTQELSDGEIYYIIQNGIRLTGMPAFGEPGRADDPSTWNLVHFIRHLPELTKEEEAEMLRHNPISRQEMERQLEVERFLGGESEAPAPRREHQHEH